MGDSQTLSHVVISIFMLMLFLVPAGILTLHEDTQAVEAYDFAVPVKCVATGFPRPTVEWSRNGNVLVTRASSIYNINRTIVGRDLMLKQVTLSDRGKYSCTATNTIDSTTFSAEKNFSLAVNSE